MVTLKLVQGITQEIVSPDISFQHIYFNFTFLFYVHCYSQGEGDVTCAKTISLLNKNQALCPEVRSVELWDLGEPIPYFGDPWVGEIVN